MGVLCLFRWSSGAAQRTKRKKKFAGTGGRSLGRASAADLNGARMARLSNNRRQIQATMAKKDKRQKQLSIRAPKPSSAGSGSSSYRPPSPRSVTQLTTKLPEELQSKATRHFFVDGPTKFIALPPMPRSDDAVAILRRIASEFIPIIRKRGFNIRSVSEMCCCGDGLEYELGGERRSVPAGETIVGNDHDTVAGYNGKLINNFGLVEHVIHLRLRLVDDHNKFMEYDEIIDTMAHELAHCVHEDHGPEFWDLMEDILKDRVKIVEDLKNGVQTPYDSVAAAKELFGGFDIYRTVAGQMRNWNGQVSS